MTSSPNIKAQILDTGCKLVPLNDVCISIITVLYMYELSFFHQEIFVAKISYFGVLKFVVLRISIWHDSLPYKHNIT